MILEKDLQHAISEIESAAIEDKPALIEQVLDQIESNDSD